MLFFFKQIARVVAFDRDAVFQNVYYYHDNTKRCKSIYLQAPAASLSL